MSIRLGRCRTPDSPGLRAKRRLFMLGSALGTALAAFGHSAPAHAQAFDATPTTAAGSVSYDRGTPGTETITVESQSAVIDWALPPSPLDPHVFLPDGNIAIFQNGLGNADFAVLNRIITDNPVRFDGTVISRLRALGGGEPTAGGTVYFSSPGGIIVGANAVFDVGNLVLTTLDVLADPNGNFIFNGTSVFENGALNPTSAVVTELGAQINASRQGSYVAMVAPVVTHAGSVRVNGTAAYIAGENVSVTVNDGLFDIVVIAGSDNATPLEHTGNTGGPSSTGPGDNHRIYMVAVPKNQAITALLQGNVGFDEPDSVAVENGVIILSSGFSVRGDEVEAEVFNTNDASFNIVGGTMTSDVRGHAVTDFFASGEATGSLIFNGDVAINALERARLFAGGGQTVTVEGNAVVSAARTRNPLNLADVNVEGGEAMIFAQEGGALTIAGSATVDASGRGALGETGEIGSGTGGTARIFADNGDVNIGGGVDIRARGDGTNAGEAIPDQGGEGTGGTIALAATNGGSLTVGGNLTADAGGRGTRGNGLGGGEGAIGDGGSIDIGSTSGGAISIAGTASLRAEGQGGSVEGGTLASTGGRGFGGSITIGTDGGSIDFAGAVDVRASGIGGIGPNGGDASEAEVAISATNGIVDFGGALSVQASGTGGDAAFVRGGTGGSGTGGSIVIAGNNGATAGRIEAGSVTLTARGVGGDATVGGSGVDGGLGGDGDGGDVTVLAGADRGEISFGATSADVSGIGGNGGSGSDPGFDGGNGGAGLAGGITLGVAPLTPSGGAAGLAQFASLTLAANGSGGDGGAAGAGAAALGGDGGNANGGNILLRGNGGPLTVAGGIAFTADAIAGDGGAADGAANAGTEGLARGGELVAVASVHPAGRRGSIAAASLTGTLNGTGNAGSQAGFWRLLLNQGDMNFATIDLTGRTNATPADPTPSDIQLNNGVLTATTSAEFDAQGSHRVTATGSGRLVGGAVTFITQSDFVASHNGRAADAATIAATSLNVDALGDFDAAAGTRLTGTASVSVRADGANIGGEILGNEIEISSRDIDLTGEVGDQNTDLVSLGVLDTSQPAVVGGTTEGQGYTLTDAEADRIAADRLAIGVEGPAGAAPAMIVRDLSLSATGANSVGTLALGTNTVMQVEGAVLLANAGPDNAIEIAAGTRLQIVTPGGSLRVRDAAGAPAGTIEIVSANIWAASDDLIGQLAADVNFAGRNEALLANDGPVEPRGYIEAADVLLRPGQTLFVQNSGAADEFAGITVVENTLTIVPSGNGPLTVYAFGRRINPDGSYVTNNGFFAEVDFQAGAGGYTDESEFNRCIINTGVCPAAGGGIPDGPAGPGGPDPIEGPVGGSDTILLPPAGDDDDLVDTSFGADPLIEEPVTSGGDSSLWNEDCDRDDDGDCDGEDRR